MPDVRAQSASNDEPSASDRAPDEVWMYDVPSPNEKNAMVPLCAGAEVQRVDPCPAALARPPAIANAAAAITSTMVNVRVLLTELSSSPLRGGRPQSRL